MERMKEVEKIVFESVDKLSLKLQYYPFLKAINQNEMYYQLKYLKRLKNIAMHAIQTGNYRKALRTTVYMNIIFKKISERESSMKGKLSQCILDDDKL